MIVPAYCQLKSFCAQVGGVFFRRSRTVYAGEHFPGNQHVFGIADKQVGTEVEPIVEESEVESQIVVDNGFPSEFSRGRSRDGSIGDGLAVHEISAQALHIQLLYVWITVGYGLIAQRSGAESYLKVREYFAYGVEECFFAHSVAYCKRGEESGSVVFGKPRRGIPSYVELGQIFSGIVVSDSSEVTQ